MACRYTYEGKTYSAAEFMRVLSDLPPSKASAFIPSVVSVPEAPFVNKTDEWAMLAFKRMARWAVDNGFDSIAWTTGAQQTDRYNDATRQNVDEIRYEKDEDGTWEIAAYKNGSETFSREGLTESKLTELVGKDVAAKIVNDEGEALPDQPYRDWKSLQGDDLHIGGEGMRGFYDNILPFAVNKWAKKLGGKVGRAEILTDPVAWDDPNTTPITEDGEVIRNVHALDLTPAMRDAVAAGQPLFSMPDQTQTPEFKRWFGDSKVVDENGEPLVVYHATDAEFDVFDFSMLGRFTRANAISSEALVMAEVGAWTNTSPLSKRTYQSRDMELYLALDNPMEISFDDLWGMSAGFESGADMRESLERQGYDGLIVDDSEFGGTSYVAFRPNQIKSATGNNGQFDPANSDIRFSLPDPGKTKASFFRDSKVRDDNGELLNVYHGTAEDFFTFDDQRAGEATGHSSAPLGNFFTGNRKLAEGYAANAADGVPAFERVIEVNLNITNPYSMSLDEMQAIESKDEARAIRQWLERQGYDGIRVGEADNWITFRSNQSKDIRNEKPTDNPDIRYSLPDPDEVVRDIEAVMASDADATIMQKARRWLSEMVPKKLKDQWRPAWLGALTTDHLTELGADYHPNMGLYSTFLKEMAAQRNDLQQQGEDIAESVRTWAAKNPEDARKLFRLMHDATVDGVDPDQSEYQPLQFRFGGKLHDVNKKNVGDAIKAINQLMRERSGENKTDLLAEKKALRAMLAAEPGRRAKHPGMVERFEALPEVARDHYRTMRDTYAARSKMVEDGLVQRIKDTDTPENHKRAIIASIRSQFETQRLQGVYFPLHRQGQYFVAAEKGETNTYLMFESLSKLEAAVADLKKRGFTINAQGMKGEGRAVDAPSGTFAADIIQQLQKAGVSEKTQDDVWQIYLHTLPELSMRKKQIHRKSVPGFDPDALRAFAWSMHHGAHQIARLNYAHKLTDTISLLRNTQDAARREPDADSRRIAAGDAVLNELEKRHQWIMNPQDSKTTGLVSSFGFLYYLGLTPAAALVNMTQTALLTFPYLASRHGTSRAMNMLLSTMKDSMLTTGHIQNRLTDPDEIKAHAELQRMGALDKTQTHNLAGIAEGGMSGHNPKWAKAMQIIGWGFHKAEVVNRESSGIAAYRLARQDGKSHDEAVKFAARVINDTHFDYQNQNRARYMQSGAAKVLLMFRQYSLNMTWHLGRMVWNATKNTDPETRKLARRNLAGVLGMSAVFSGTMGLPLMSVAFGVLNAIAASFGDDDEPWDAETEFKAFLKDMFGADVASVIADGAVNKLTGADIASRVSLSQLWFRDADRELDGRGQYFYLLEQAAGPMGGVLKNLLVGKQMMDEGHFVRGVETVMPKAVKDAIRATRYAAQGASTLRGDPLMEDVSLRQLILQASGFTPAELADRYDDNRALKNYEQHILNRRSYLLNALALSVRAGDQDARAAVMKKIQAFNRTNREIAITTKSIQTSLRARARYSRQAENGIMLNRKLADRLRERTGTDG